MASSTTWNPQTYARNARFVSDLGAPLLGLLDAKPEESVLDLGCGDGALTEKIATSGCTVVGADSSLAQIQAAKKRGLNALVIDGRRFFFRRVFDAVFTNAALHWIKEAEDVVTNVAGCLTSHGRFVGEFGGKGNVDKIRVALHDGVRHHGIDPWRVDPWYYPSLEDYATLLKKHGFTVDYIELLPRPTQLPGDILDWLEIFAQPFTQALAESQRERFLDEIKETLRPSLQNPDGTWRADYVRLRFRAIKACPSKDFYGRNPP
jgi:trans-aconitate methyltransferase